MEQLEPVDSEIVNRLNTAYRKVLIVGKDVFVPPIYSHRDRPYQFHVKQLRVLYYLAKNNNDLEKACLEANVPVPYAKRFLKSPDYKAFAREALQDQAIQDGWTVRRLMIEIDKVYQGEVKKDDVQMDALKMMKDIIVPKKMEAPTAAGVTVNLNFPILPVEMQAKLKALADEAASIDVENAA